MDKRDQPQMLEIASDCARRGDFRGVIDVCSNILAADPEQPDALHYMGLLYRRAGNIAAAITSHERAARQRPDNAEFLNALGLAYRAADRYADAIDVYQAALRIDPEFIDAYVNLGQAYFARGDVRNATARFRDAAERHPAQPQLHVALGHCHCAQGDRRSAEASFRRALTLDPNFGPAYTALGDFHSEGGDRRAALAAYASGIEHDPHDAANYLRMAPMLVGLGQSDAAFQTLDKGVRQSPGTAGLQVALARMMLRREEWRDGWLRYERRMSMPPLVNEQHRFPQPFWNGADPRGKRICVHFEPGIGESLALLRYLDPLLEAGAEITLRCHPMLERLLQSLVPKMAVIPFGDAPPEFDLQIWLGSLPFRLRLPDPSGIAPIPPGFANPPEFARWQERCAHLPRPLIGLHWKSPTGASVFEDMRNLLATFAPYEGGLLGLQDAGAQDDIAWVGTLDHMVHVGAELGSDTADIVCELVGAAAQCDLVVTVDSPIAQLAAMLGRPTLLLVEGSEEFFWPLDAAGTAWFEQITILHRHHDDDDAGFVDRIQRAVEETLAPAPAPQQHPG